MSLKYKWINLIQIPYVGECFASHVCINQNRLCNRLFSELASIYLRSEAYYSDEVLGPYLSSNTYPVVKLVLLH